MSNPTSIAAYHAIGRELATQEAIVAALKALKSAFFILKEV